MYQELQNLNFVRHHTHYELKLKNHTIEIWENEVHLVNNKQDAIFLFLYQKDKVEHLIKLLE